MRRRFPQHCRKAQIHVAKPPRHCRRSLPSNRSTVAAATVSPSATSFPSISLGTQRTNLFCRCFHLHAQLLHHDAMPRNEM
ncbi:hypothetical protein M0R45_019648 [Rubus argutus]|uniref:Uncharacterized protein n=1 Tax=Rubus argutus TaxID=59490 RepID=A0AAW1X7Y9_RUBAR